MKRLLLLDCDQFFVQCARLADPEGAGKAQLLLVGGTPEGRGVVTSASYEARRYGCRSAMPTAQALRLCPEALVVPVPRETCLRKSGEVRAVLERFTPLVEAASIDEAFLDLTGTERLYGGEDPGETARRIQAAVVEETRIIVSIGGGSSRIVAKLAAERAKPGGVFVLTACPIEGNPNALRRRRIKVRAASRGGNERRGGARSFEVRGHGGEQGSRCGCQSALGALGWRNRPLR